MCDEDVRGPGVGRESDVWAVNGEDAVSVV